MSELDENFILSAQKGDIGTVEGLLEQGADIHASDDKAFMSAFERGNEKMLRLLFDHERSSGQIEQWNFDRSIYWFNRISGMNTPDHLPQKDGKRNGTEFDANLYFLVLPHLSMKEGFRLDYAYLYFYESGEPALFARPVDSENYWSSDDWSDWVENNHYLDYIVADGSPESYLELVLLSTMGSHFYLFWHAQYMDTRLITDTYVADHIKDILNEYCLKQNIKNKKEQLEIIEPTVELKENSSVVTYCTFSEWTGIVRHRKSYKRYFPHKLLDEEETTIVQYDSGIDI